MGKCRKCGGITENGVCVSCGCKAVSAANEPSEWAEMDCIGVPSANEVSRELPKKSASYANAPKYEPKPEAEEKRLPPTTNYTHISAPVEEPYEEPPKAYEIFIHGFAEEVRKHWWKVLLIAFVPVSAIFMGSYYLVKGGARRHRLIPADPERLNYKDIFTGILFFAIGMGMILSGWDPIGLDERLLDLVRDGHR